MWFNIGMTNTAKPDSAPAETKPRRSKAKLAAMVLVPMLVAGGVGYAGWAYFLGTRVQAEAAPEPDPVQVSAVPTAIAAETSFTHSYALASIIAHECGRVPMRALKGASDEEAVSDGMLVNLSWSAAARRVATLDERNCRLFLTEVRTAEAKAARIVSEREKAAQKH